MSYKAKGLALVAAALLIGASMATSASAATLRRGSTGSGGAAISAGGPGEVLWTWYETTDDSLSEDHHAGHGDNIIRLINPVGSANPATTGLSTSNACAMIYVFDDDEEMGECCGCPITPTQLATISVEDELTDNWGISGNEGADNDNGAIAIIAVPPNRSVVAVPDSHGCEATQPGTGFGACNGGCDPGATPGWTVSAAKNLLGSITHNQEITGSGAFGPTTTSGLTEVALFDDAGGDPNNLTYLQTQCSFLVGNSTGGGVCECPEE